MAKTQKKTETQTVVKCDICGREIPPGAFGIPTDYVWKNGTNYCWDCLKEENRKNGSVGG